MTLRHSPPRIAPVVVVAVDPDDHAELDRRIPLAMPGRPELLVRLHPLKPVVAQLPARLGGIVVVAPATTALVDRVVELCALARARAVPSILVRFAGHEDLTGWPAHPVNVVLDVTPDRRHDVLDVLVRAFLEQAPLHLPLAHDTYAQLTLLHGDERRAAFDKALEARGLAQRVLGLEPPETGGQHGPVLCFARRASPPSPTELHPLEDDCLERDPRRYGAAVDPPDDVAARATAIAALHLAHGDWRATLAAVEAFADGDVDDAGDLLLSLGDALREPDVLLHRTLVARAGAMTRSPPSRRPPPLPSWVRRAPGFDDDTVALDDAGRRAFWARVDASFEPGDDDDDVDASADGGPLVC
jgi:hypothetical protein